MRHVLTDAEKRALEVLSQTVWARPSNESRLGNGYNAAVHGATARRLEKRGLVKSCAQLPDGREVRGADLARYFGHWSTKFTITKKGRLAIQTPREAWARQVKQLNKEKRR